MKDERQKADESTLKAIRKNDGNCELLKDHDFTREQIGTLIKEGLCHDEIIQRQFHDVPELVKDDIYDNAMFCELLAEHVEYQKIAYDELLKASLETGICTRQIFHKNIRISNDVARHAIDLLDKGSTWLDNLGYMPSWQLLPSEDITRLLQILKRREKEEVISHAIPNLLENLYGNFGSQHVKLALSLNVRLPDMILSSFLHFSLEEREVIEIMTRISTEIKYYDDALATLLSKFYLLDKESLKLFAKLLPTELGRLSQYMRFPPYLLDEAIKHFTRFERLDFLNSFHMELIDSLLDVLKHHNLSEEQVRALYKWQPRRPRILDNLIMTQTIPQDIVDEVLHSESFRLGYYDILQTYSLTDEQIFYVIQNHPQRINELVKSEKNFLSEEHVKLILEQSRISSSTMVDLFKRNRQAVTPQIIAAMMKSDTIMPSVMDWLQPNVTSEILEEYLQWAIDKPLVRKDFIFTTFTLPEWFINAYIEKIKEEEEDIRNMTAFVQEQHITIEQLKHLIPASKIIKSFLKYNRNVTRTYVDEMMNVPEIAKMVEDNPNFREALLQNVDFQPSEEFVNDLIEQNIGLETLLSYHGSRIPISEQHVNMLIAKENKKLCKLLIEKPKRFNLHDNQINKCLQVLHEEIITDDFYIQYMKGRDVWHHIPADTFSDAVEAFSRAIRQSKTNPSPINKLIEKYENVELGPSGKEMMDESLHHNLQALARKGGYRTYYDDWDYLYRTDEQDRVQKRSIGKYLAALANKGNVEAQEVLKEYKEAKKLMASKTIKATVVISNDPVDIMGKTTGKGWSSCEHVDNASTYGSPRSWLRGEFEDGDRGCGWCDDIAYNNLIAYFIPEGEERWGGRTMIRWCDDDFTGKHDVGFSQYYGRDVYEDSFFKFLEKTLTDKGYLRYNSCTTPYEYSGYAAYEESGSLYSQEVTFEDVVGRELDEDEINMLVKEEVMREIENLKGEKNYHEEKRKLLREKKKEITDIAKLGKLTHEIDIQNNTIKEIEDRMDMLEQGYEDETIAYSISNDYSEGSISPRLVFYIDKD